MAKNTKYFIGYLYNDHKVSLLQITLPKTSAYVKSYDGQIKLMHFLLKRMTYQKNIILFGIKSALIYLEFDSEHVYINTFLKAKINPHGDEGTNF